LLYGKRGRNPFREILPEPKQFIKARNMRIAIISDIHDNLVNLEKCLAWCAENKIEKIICCGDITNSETLSILANYKSPLKITVAAEHGGTLIPSKKRGGSVLRDGVCYSQKIEVGCVFLVRGNMEIYKEEELAAYPNIINGGRTAVWNIGGKIIGACHEPFLIKEVFAITLPLYKGELEGVKKASKTIKDPLLPPPLNLPLGQGEKTFSKGRRNPDIIFYGHTHKPWIEEKNNTKLVNPGTLGGVFSRATFAVYDTEKIEPELKILDLL
jgi:predicted phosphodiesterase